jgi:hypothetical protein
MDRGRRREEGERIEGGEEERKCRDQRRGEVKGKKEERRGQWQCKTFKETQTHRDGERGNE